MYSLQFTNRQTFMKIASAVGIDSNMLPPTWVTPAKRNDFDVLWVFVLLFVAPNKHLNAFLGCFKCFESILCFTHLLKILF